MKIKQAVGCVFMLTNCDGQTFVKSPFSGKLVETNPYEYYLTLKRECVLDGGYEDALGSLSNMSLYFRDQGGWDVLKYDIVLKIKSSKINGGVKSDLDSSLRDFKGMTKGKSDGK